MCSEVYLDMRGLLMTEKDIDVVKIDNSFNRSHVFSRLNAIEQNVAYSIFSKFSTGDTINSSVDSMTIDAGEIKRLSELNKKSKLTKTEYRKLLEKLRVFFLSSFFVVHVMENDNIIEKGTPIFHSFDLINDGEKVYVELMPEAAHLFAKIFDGLGFTIFALKSMVAIPSPTAKNLYRLFLDGKHVYGWNATREELFDEFKFSKNTAFSSFIRRLDGYLNEVRATGDFEHLEYDLIRDKTKRGAPIVSVHFTIKIKRNRMDKLIHRYHTSKPKKKPYFFPMSKFVDSIQGTDLATNSDGTIIATQKVIKKQVPIKCPLCGGQLLAFLDKKEKACVCCDNSNFFHIGGNCCSFFRFLENNDTLPDDIANWVNDIEKTIPEESVVDYLKNVMTKELEQENMQRTNTSDDNIDDSPFPN